MAPINLATRNKNPRRRVAGIFVLSENCTPCLMPSVTPQRLARETSSVQKVLNPTALINAAALFNIYTPCNSASHVEATSIELHKG
ncbi:MAG: hypothetical protein Ta2B_24520 [Termitinemataceae bacterium]|nr:MAG: hypothetical protein Ta2B_24520 [Termitinemataceae bacterium]